MIYFASYANFNYEGRSWYWLLATQEQSCELNEILYTKQRAWFSLYVSIYTDLPNLTARHPSTTSGQSNRKSINKFRMITYCSIHKNSSCYLLVATSSLFITFYIFHFVLLFISFAWLLVPIFSTSLHRQVSFKHRIILIFLFSPVILQDPFRSAAQQHST